MAVDRINDPRAFHTFLQEKLAEGCDGLSLEDYLHLWDFENQGEAERHATLQAIREGLADVEAGRTRPAREALAELRRKHRRPEGR